MPENKPFKTWDQYVKEADKVPFELPVSADKTIIVKTPSGEQLMKAQALGERGLVKDQLAIICGDAADDIIPLVKAAPGGAMGELISDIMAHFGYGVEDEDELPT